MSLSTHRFVVAEARSIKHPEFKEIQKHYFLVRAKDLPEEIRADANAREPVGTNRQVYRDVRDSLLGQTSKPGSFDLMNKGITILATGVRRVNDLTYDVTIDDGQGIVDGGHTYRIICENKDCPSLPDNQFVEIQVRTGVPEDLITDIARGLNTGIQVKSHSLANLDGAYDWLKAEIKDEPYYKHISWREGDEAEYDVRDLISVLEALNIYHFPNNLGTHPIQAYEKWSIPCKKFSDDYENNKDDLSNSVYYRLRPILKEALALYDRIRHDFREIHNSANNGNAGQLKIMEAARPNKKFDFIFAPGLKPQQFRLTKGALFPIFAGFRNCVEDDPKKNEACWTDGFSNVLKLWEEVGPELVQETHQATKDIGCFPDQLGKNRGHWSNLHKTLELHMLRRKLSKRSR